MICSAVTRSSLQEGVTRASLMSWNPCYVARTHFKHVDITKYLRYLAVYLFIVPLMESDGVGHISLDKWFPIVQHLHSRKNSGLNNLLVSGQPADCNIDRCYKILPKTTAGEKMTNL